MSVTPNMSLNESSPLITGGPLWASNHESNWLILDSHDHSTGKGVQIGPSGLSINNDLPFGGNNATALRSTRFTSQSALLSGASDVGCVYVVSGNLYYNNGSGQAVQITSGTSVNVSGVGGITGMGGTTAAVTYFSGTPTFIFTQNSGVSANLDAGSVILRQNVASAHGITLQSPNSLGGDYSMTWFSALPSADQALPLLSSTGVWSTLALGSAYNVPQVNAGGTALGYGLISRQSLAAVGQGVSSGSGTWQTNSNTAVAVTNLSTTLTTTGRPVMLMLQTATNSGLSYIGLVNSGAWTSGMTGYIQLVRDGVVFGQVLIGIGNIGSTVPQFIYTPSGACNTLDTGASAGSHTYTVNAYIGSPAGSYEIQVYNVTLVAYEL